MDSLPRSRWLVVSRRPWSIVSTNLAIQLALASVTCTRSPARRPRASRRSACGPRSSTTRVAAPEHRERAERVEPAGAARAAARRPGGAAARSRRRAVRRPATSRVRMRGQTPAQVERRRAGAAAAAAGGRGAAMPARMTRASACVSSAACAAAHRHAAGNARERRPAARRCGRAGSGSGCAPRAPARQPILRADRSARENSSLRGDDDLGGRRRRRRAEVGDEVGDRDVGLVADGGDDRHRTTRAIARATTSSLNAQRSSIDPPPRPTITTSTPGTRPIARSAARDRRAPRPRPARAPAESRCCALA